MRVASNGSSFEEKQVQSNKQQQALNSVAQNNCPPSDSAKDQSPQQDQFAQAAQNKPTFGYTQATISDYVKPNFYTLRLKLDPRKKKFSGQIMISVDVSVPEIGPNSSLNLTLADSEIGRDKSTGELGFRYITLNAGSNVEIKKAFYVFTTKGSVQIPATKIGKNETSELLTLDFYPNFITSGQGLILIVYTA